MGPSVEPWVREAVDRGLPESQLELHFQPVVRLDGRGVYGAETFLRWLHPERGMIPAGQWLPYAIGSGAAVALSAAALPAWAAYARQLPGLVLSFNVSGADLLDDAYMTCILGVGDAGTACLAVEVEHLHSHPDIPTRLALLRAHGFSVWLDDFGDGSDDETTAVGPSVDVVKLDMSLLELERSQLAGLTARLHDHGKVVLVEGVESAAHERSAIETGIDLASGFRYAAPLTKQHFADYLATQAPTATG